MRLIVAEKKRYENGLLYFKIAAFTCSPLSPLAALAPDGTPCLSTPALARFPAAPYSPHLLQPPQCWQYQSGHGATLAQHWRNNGATHEQILTPHQRDTGATLSPHWHSTFETLTQHRPNVLRNAVMHNTKLLKAMMSRTRIGNTYNHSSSLCICDKWMRQTWGSATQWEATET